MKDMAVLTCNDYYLNEMTDMTFLSCDDYHFNEMKDMAVPTVKIIT